MYVYEKEKKMIAIEITLQNIASFTKGLLLTEIILLRLKTNYFLLK